MEPSHTRISNTAVQNLAANPYLLHDRSGTNPLAVREASGERVVTERYNTAARTTQVDRADGRLVAN